MRSLLEVAAIKWRAHSNSMTASRPLLLLLLALAGWSVAALEVGMMYEGWQAPAYWGRSRSNELTIETVVRSNGSHSLADMAVGMNGTAQMRFWWHKEPADGFYCIYRKRATEAVSSCGLPDCPGICHPGTAMPLRGHPL